MYVLGSGSFGTVAKAYCFQSKQTVAVKRIADFDTYEYKTVQALREVMLMKELNARPDGGRYVPIIYDILIHEEPAKSEDGQDNSKLTLFIVMEYFKTDLSAFIGKKLKEVDEQQLLKMM